MVDPNAKQQLSESLRDLELQINEATISRIIQDMADISTPLKQFTDAVLMSHDNLAKKREILDSKGQNLKFFSHRLSKTANMVAFANARYGYRNSFKSMFYLILNFNEFEKIARLSALILRVRNENDPLFFLTQLILQQGAFINYVDMAGGRGGYQLSILLHMPIK